MRNDLWTPTEIGERLRTERRRLGLSQDAFAEAGGIRRTTLYQYERGDRLPSLGFLLKCASVGLDLSYMIFGERIHHSSTTLHLEQEDLDRIFNIVDRFARDSKGRALAIEHRRELFRQLCAIANAGNEGGVDWESVSYLAEAFGG